MTIESTLATTVPCQTTGAVPTGKPSAGHGVKAGQGFAGLISALAAQETAGPSTADLTPSTLAVQDQELSLAADSQAQDGSNFIADMVLQSAGPPVVAGSTLAAAQGDTLTSLPGPTPAAALSTEAGATFAAPALALLAPSEPQVGMVQPVPTGNNWRSSAVTGVQQMASPVDGAPDGGTPAAVALAVDGSTQTVSALPESIADGVPGGPLIQTAARDAKRAAGASSALAMQQEGALPVQTKLAMAVLDATPLLKPLPDNSRAKSPSAHGTVESLAATPGLFDKLGMSATYTVAQATAVVADTKVAETVSYWVTHGVQKAELSLEGLGSEPVEVRISLDGDRARVDFRSNQPEVRQALEAAAGHLKSLLSSEGLQLAGMSVGSFGKGGDHGQEQRPNPAAVRQVRVSGVETISAAPARVTGLSAGQTLDLYV